MIGTINPFLLLAIGFAVALILQSRKSSKKALPDIPWINTHEGEFLTRLRSRFRTTFNYKDAIHRAYEQVGPLHDRLAQAQLRGIVFKARPDLHYSRY